MQEIKVVVAQAASTVEESVTGPDDASGWDRITLTFSSAWTFVDSVLQHGQNACVESPPQARDLAVDRLRDALPKHPDEIGICVLHELAANGRKLRRKGASIVDRS